MSNKSMWPLLRTGGHDPAITSRVLGVFYLAGALLVFISLLVHHPEKANGAALLAVGGFCVTVGAGSLTWAGHARQWSVHAALAVGTASIGLSVYFTGVAAGIYPVMFVWVVLVAASFFSPRAVAAHVGWIVVSWGLILSVSEEPAGYSSITRWTLGSLVLAVAAVVMTEVVAGRKSTEVQLRRAQDELKALAHYDPLTGVANQRLFDVALEREMARSTEHNSPLCLVTIDIDHFKDYNDEHGHVAGDRFLKSAASAWTATLRATDMLARVGGDEFVALLPDCPSDEAQLVVQKLRATCPQRQRCSTGIACWDGQESGADFRERVDLGMYEAKHRLPPASS